MIGIVWGFLIVSCFYLVIGIVVFLFRKDITSNMEKHLLELTNPKPK
jgi:hypothetical protein